MSWIKSISLFPIRLVQGMFWLLWSQWFDDQTLGIAPIFCKDGNAIVYIKKKAWKMQVILLQLPATNELCLFETNLPIQQLIFADNSVICSSFSKRGNIFVRISTNGEIVNYNLKAASRDYLLIPSPISLIEAATLCVNNTCKHIFYKKSESEVLQVGLSADKVKSFTVSCCAEFIGYSTANSTHILSSDSDFTLRYKDIIYMKGYGNKLLAYCKMNKQFIVIKCNNMEILHYNIPKAFSIKNVLSASLSPDGQSIAFFAYDTFSVGELVVLSLIDGNYAVIARRARVYDIQWSPSLKQISISGIVERDFFEISYSYKMRNCAVNDKEVIDLSGNVLWRSCN